MKALERIKLKSEQILYRKKGKKYVQVNDPYITDGLAEGWHLVHVTPGCISTHAVVYPDKAELQAAALNKLDELMIIIRKASEAAPRNQPLTKSQKDDWDNFIKVHGETFNTLQYPSFFENAKRIVDALIK